MPVANIKSKAKLLLWSKVYLWTNNVKPFKYVENFSV